jgi:hypothetical protein
MSLILSGTDGLSDVDGSAATPAIRGTDANTGIFFGTDIIGFSEGGVEAMRIDSSGNVGIGTTSVTGATKLEVYGNSSGAHVGIRANNAAADGYATLWLSNAGSNDGIIRGGASAGAFTNQLAMLTGGATPITFTTNSVERMRVDSSGNWRLGSLAITQGNADSISTIYGGATDSAPCLELFKGSATTSTAQVFMRFQTGMTGTPAGNGSITSNGAANVGFTTWSDRRLKENIVDLPAQLDNIMALRPVEFDYVESMGGGHQLGFIAQEVQEVYPDLVGEGADGMLTLTDMNKNDARLIKCIQEQQALITALTARIEALETP